MLQSNASPLSSELGRAHSLTRRSRATYSGKMTEENEMSELQQQARPDSRTTIIYEVPLQQSGKAGQWTKLLAFAGYASTLGIAVPAGYCIGCVNSPAVHIRQWCSETLWNCYGLEISASAMDILWSTIVSIFLVGGAVGSLSGAGVANKFGRKISIALCGLLYLTAAVCFYFCRPLNAVSLLVAGRFIVGLAAGLTTACLPMYLSEIAPLRLRGTLGVFCPVGMTAGVVVGQVLSLRAIFGTEQHWNVALSFYALLVVACCAPMHIYPESPTWLYIVRGDKETARLELKRLRGTSAADIFQIDQEIAEMETVAKTKQQVLSFGEVLRDSKLLLPLVIVCAYQGGQQLSGINAIFYYSVSIFRKAGLSREAAEWANLGAGLLNLATSLWGPMLMAKINRRPLMLSSSTGCALALLMLATLLYYIEYVSWFAMACIACIFLYIFFFQLGLSPIPFFIGAELFEIAPRSVAMSMGSISSWTCNFIIGMAFPSLQNLWGALVFLPFSITCFLLVLLTKFYLPETRGREPIEIAPLVAEGFRSKVR